MCFIRCANKTKKGGAPPRCTPQEPLAPCVFHDLLLRFSVIFPAGFFSMTPKLGHNDGLGTSFHDSIGYCCHDKDAPTTKRVAAITMVNLAATTPEEAAEEMTATFKQAGELKHKAGVSPRGRKARNPVLSWSLSWFPDEKPTHKRMIAEAKRSIEAMGYKGHQAVLVIHNDEPHPHIHIIVSRVDPKTGRMVNPSMSKGKLSRYAEACERRQGKIRCRRRVRNNAKRDRGEFIKYVPPAVAKAWESTTNGKGFAMALKRSGYILARGDSCPYVVVDPYGDAQNPRRQIAGAKAADIRARFSDLEPASLPSVEEAKAQAAQWRERQQKKEARRKARAKSRQNRRNWEARRNRRSRARPVPASATATKAVKRTPARKPQTSPYRGEEKKAVPEPPKPIQAPVEASTAFHACGISGGRKPQRPGLDAQGPPCRPSIPATHVPANRHPIPAPLP